MTLLEKLMNISLKEWLEYCYLFLFGLIFADQFLHTTMIPIVYNHEQIHIALRIILICLIFAKLNLTDRPNRKKILLIVFLSVCFFAAYYRRSHYEELLFMSLLIIGANEVPLDKILVTYFVIGTILTLVIMVLAQVGAIENLVYIGRGGMRYSFGGIYPTDFSAHLVYLSCAYAYIRRRSYHLVEPLFIIFLSWFVMEYCKARNNAGCLLILGLLLILYKVYLLYYEKLSNGIRRLLKVAKYSLLLAPDILMICIFVLTYNYNNNSNFLAKINSYFSGRLAIGKKAFDLYPITYFGQYIPMNGNGGTLNKVDNYFFIDSSYIKMILCYGLLVSFCILLLFIIIQIRIIRFHDVILAIVIGVISIQCMFEHHILEIAYNPFFLTVLATISSSSCDKP